MDYSSATSVLLNYSIFDAVDRLASCGFKGVDIWCGRPHVYRKDIPIQELHRLRRVISDAGLQIVSLMPAFFRYPYSLSSPMDAVRQDSLAYVRDCVDSAVALDCRQVLLVPSTPMFDQGVENARQLFLDSVRQLCDYAEQAGVILGIEAVYPGLSGYMGSSRDALLAVNAVGSPNLKIVLDTGHVNLSGEDFADAVKAVGENLLQVHINDNDGIQQQNAVPGQGVIDFAAVRDALNVAGYDGFLTVELGWPYSSDPLPPLQTALQRTREIFG